MKNRASLVVLFSFALLVSACSNGRELEEPEIDFGYEYYPLSIGRSWTYQVDSILYQPGVGGVVKDSSSSFLRETIVDTTTDLTGEILYIVERYDRPDQASPWQIAKVFTRSRSETQAFQTEDNLKFIKMPFPVERGKRWDGHAYFDVAREFPVGGEFLAIYIYWDYLVAETNQNIEIAGRAYDQVITIQQADYTGDITKVRVAEEKYARDIGLIFREWFIADSQCNNCQAVPWTERAEEGFYLRQALIAHE